MVGRVGSGGHRDTLSYIEIHSDTRVSVSTPDTLDTHLSSRIISVPVPLTERPLAERDDLHSVDASGTRRLAVAQARRWKARAPSGDPK